MGKKKVNVLFVGAHPDDIELGCGGTILKHIENEDNVFCLVLTNGEKGNHPSDKEECIASLNSLGIKEIFFGNFPDGYIADNHKTVSFIESLIKNLDIHRIYTHDPNDKHQDHRNCSLAVSSAARKVKEILLFQGPSTTNFESHYLIGLSENHLNKKIEALKKYKSQIEKSTVNIPVVKKIAEINGYHCNSQYAEAFNLNHIFVDEENV
ncbi:MAG: PIG-L family deacetylase [Candidatus Pacearchaeota archaeon]